MNFVKTEIKNKIFNIILNRPDKKNAFNQEMIIQIRDAFVEASKKNNICGVFVSGEGDCFCAGADLMWMKSMVSYSLDENIKDSEILFDMFKAGLDCPVPVVGLFQGYVMGGATGLVSICDIGVSLKDTKYCFSEVKLGLAPAVISPFILSKMNINKANEYMLTAKLFTGLDALSANLVEYAVSAEESNELLEKIFNRLRNNGPQAVRETKKLIRLAKQSSIESIKKQTAKVISERRMSAEGQEGLASFFEKRKPNWIGESH